MSGTQGVNQQENYRTPEERAQIQASMLTAIERMKDPAVVANDMEVFFAGMDDHEFSPAHASGLDGLDNPQSRLTMVRLYMLKEGVSLETIFSQEQKAMDIKRQMGQSFRDIIFSGELDTIGPELVEMTQCINSAKIHPADLMDDKTLADNYLAFAFFRDAANVLNKSMEDADVEHLFSKLNLYKLDGTVKGTGLMGTLMDTAALRITDASYSSANNAKLASLGGVLPGSNMNETEKYKSIFIGYKLREELETHNLSGNKDKEIEIYEMLTFSKSFRVVSQANYEAEGIQPKDLEEAFDYLNDFEELSFDNEGKLTAGPQLTHTVQKERDRVQTILFDQLHARYGAEARVHDMGAFFGERKDADFVRSKDTLDRPFDLHRDVSRLDYVRLYMVAVGEIPIEDVFSQDQGMMDQKREWGERFCDLMLDGDAAAIAEANVKMAKYLFNAKIPNTDLNNDATIAESYSMSRFLIDSTAVLYQAMGYPEKFDSPPSKGHESLVNNFRERLTPDEIKQFSNLNAGMTVFKSATHPKIVEITSENYSGANEHRKDGLKYGISIIHGGKVNENDFSRVVHTSANIKNLYEERFSEAGGKGFDTLADIDTYSVGYQAPDSAQAKEIKEQYRKPGDQAPAKTTRESLSLQDFHSEVHAVKHTRNIAKVRETFQPKSTGTAKEQKNVKG